ncbi:MAG TPA: phosphatase PAP2 family protein [Bacteroidia bacterium]|jgi:hypothetical protein|nr:phosphatase PAP2 family protein [Bacteroidia bacterium]
MRQILVLLFIGISIITKAQGAVKDSTKSLGNIIQLVIKDTSKREETKKDTVLESKLETHFYGLRQFEHETFLFIKAPVRWHSNDWIRASLVTALTLSIMPIDQYVSNTITRQQYRYVNIPVLTGRIYGEWYSIGAVTLVFAGYGILTHNIKAKKIAIELLQSGIYSELITEKLIVGIGRAKPYENKAAFTYHPFTFASGYNSIPSVYVTSAFALSTIMFRHAHSTLLKIFSFLPAALTVLSRIYEGQDWASDSFLGGAIGFSTGMWVVTLHEGKMHKINIPSANSKNTN